MKLNKIDKMLKILASFIFAFIVATIIIYTVKNWQYDTLITCVLGGGGLEALIMGLIKIANICKEGKIPKEDSDNDVVG